MKLVLIVAGVGLVLFLTWVIRHKSESPASARLEPIPMTDLELSDTPDTPEPFGYKMAWLAIKGANPERLVAELNLTEALPANWSTGIRAVYQDMTTVFVSPPVQEWVFVVGLLLPELGKRGAQIRGEELLQDLAKRYEDVQYFGTHRVVEYHAWSRYIKGEHVRTYAYLGERGETQLDLADQTPEEVQLGFRFFDERSPEAREDAYWERSDLRFPRENDVMKLAGKWSLNPTLLDRISAGPAVGWLGRGDPRWSAD
jgi:hypothetical protein